MTSTPTLLQAIRELAQEHIQFVDDACLAFHAGGDTRLAKHALRLVEIVELYQAAIEQSIARSDDYGDSHCSQPIRQALLAADKVASRE